MKWFELKIPPLLITAILGLLIWFFPTSYVFNKHSVFITLAILFLACGLTLSILGVLQFRKMKTTVNPLSPEDSHHLVVSGIYKYTRNPMYLGFLFFLLSLVCLSRTPLSMFTIVIFVLYMNIFQINPEERILEKKFGSKFLKYKKNVRRWL